MLRVFVLLLLLANGCYFAFANGWLQAMGLAPQLQGEPERLERQIRPEWLRVNPRTQAAAPAGAAPARTAPATATAAVGAADLSTVPETRDAAPPTELASFSAPAPTADATQTARSQAPGECWQVGLFDADEAAVLRRAAASLPSGSWVLDSTPLPARWMVYMGRLADEDAVAKKRAELRALGVPYDRPGAALEPGLSLGRFSSEERAQRGLVNLSNQGVRSARVVVERRETPGFTLRLPNADAALRRQVQALGSALAGNTLRVCG